MTRRERILATLDGKETDRPPVSFYEINGLDEDAINIDPFNIYNDPSWKPLIDLAKQKTDRIVIRGILGNNFLPDPIDQISNIQTYIEDGSRITIKTLEVSNKTLTSKIRRDPDVNTIWTLEPLLKNIDDLKTFLTIPLENTDLKPYNPSILNTERILGDSGIVMIDTPDPLCLAASLFDLGDYCTIALTENILFHTLLEKFASILFPRIELFAKEFPSHLWRIYGPEYASPPLLPPKLFKEYVVKYDTPIIKYIHNYCGYARIHSHGKLRHILDDIISMEADALDPIEPPPQGDVELAYVRERYGEQLVLFGNLEVSDIENMQTNKFEEKIKRSLYEGSLSKGRGFVLMPSAAPYGRILSSLSLKNYEKIIEVTEKFQF